MSYRFFPYFWGRRSTWLDRLAIGDGDPQFAEFLKAGSARVLVAVRPGFENAALHYLESGDIWDGAGPPAVTTEKYAALAAEIAELSDRDSEEEPVGEPWEMRIPTSLVHLRDEPGLPAWERDSAGDWVGS
jgi:hypothetical protein